MKLARLSHTRSTAAADTLALTRAAPSCRLDVASATPSPPLSPRRASGRRLDGLATNGCEKGGLIVPQIRPARLHFVAAVLVALAAAPTAQADSIGGDCRYSGQATTFVDGVVFKEPNYFDKSKIDIIVALTTFRIDKAALAKTPQKSAALTSQRFAADDARSVKLRIDGKMVSAVDYSGDGTSVSSSGGDIGEIAIKVNDATRIEASYALKDDDEDDLNCTLSFNLSYASTTPASAAAYDGAKTAAAPAAPKGKALPAGGGEPGKVFQANLAAMRTGNVDAMLATVTKEQGDKMRAQKSDPTFGAMLEMMKAFAPKSATVTGGQDFGDSAELTLDAVDQSGVKTTGTSTLRKEGGQWKVEKTSMKGGM